MKHISFFAIILILSANLYSKVINVPKDYPKIQIAVDSAFSNDTVFIANGIYQENITLNKSLSLIGEDKDSTRLRSSTQTPFHIDSASNIKISTLTIEKMDPGYASSLMLEYCQNVELSKVKIIGAIGYPSFLRGEPGAISVYLLHCDTVVFNKVEITGGPGGAGIPTGGGFGGAQGYGGTAVFVKSSKHIRLDSSQIRGGKGEPIGKSFEIQITSNVYITNSLMIGNYVCDTSSIIILQSITSVNGNIDKTILSFELSQNYPNPFNPSTTIQYKLLSRSFVTLAIYDILGRDIATLVKKEQSAGDHQVTFNGNRFASGVYIYRLHTAEQTVTKRMVLAR